MIFRQATRRSLASALCLLLAFIATSCQSPVEMAPTRSSFRQDTNFPAPIDVPGPSNERPAAEALRAAQDGTDWLMRTRADDGSWASPYPVAISALALSAALRDDRMEVIAFRRYWEETIRFLLAQQQDDGSLSRANSPERPYEHALAARALCEAMAHYAEPAIEQAARAATDHILAHQQTEGGWHYGYADGRQRSTPLTVVQMDALFSAAQRGISTPEIQLALDRAAQNLADAQDPDSGRYGYLFRGIGQTVINGYALYGMQLAGWGLSQSARAGWLDTTQAMPAWPDTLKRPFFAAYYRHQAHYHLGGMPWNSWRDPFYNELLSGQQEDGYWTAPFLETDLGDAYATALAVLMIRSTDRTPRLVTRYNHPRPGPVYRLDDVYLWTSSPVEDPDQFLIDAYMMDVIDACEHFMMEGAPRTWIHHLSSLLASYDLQPEQNQIPQTLRHELNTLFGVPASKDRLWDDVPPWAIALLVWGDRFELSERTLESTVEHHVRMRLPAGRAMEPIVADTLYAEAFAQLTYQEGVELLRHALAMRGDTPLILDRMADAWSTGNAEEIAAWVLRLYGDDPVIQKIGDRLFGPARDGIVDAVLRARANGSPTLVLIPAWHLYGPDGVLARLEARGHAVARMP